MEKEEIKNNKLLLLGRLFTDLMHEVRNPISVMKINLELLEDGMKNGETSDFEEIISGGKEAVEIMERLIAQTMEFIRGNEDEFETCSVKSIVDTAYRFMVYQAKKTGIAFHKKLPNEDVSILGNKSQIIQVLLNLISNAFDAVGESAKVIVKAYYNDENVFIEVIDNGSGIQKEKQQKIFDKFFTTKKSGVGIGLAVTKEIIHKHNAEISFESEVNKGTKFVIKFKNAKELNL